MGGGLSGLIAVVSGGNVGQKKGFPVDYMGFMVDFWVTLKMGYCGLSFQGQCRRLGNLLAYLSNNFVFYLVCFLIFLEVNSSGFEVGFVFASSSSRREFVLFKALSMHFFSYCIDFMF